MKYVLAIIALLLFESSAQAGTGACGTGNSVVYDGTSLGCGAPQRPSSTVANLPACNAGNTGLMYIVTNALAPVGLSAVTGGGAVTIGVICNGSSWIVQ
jgi:hypothetical protein